jgi:hypothetical protein
MMDRRQLLLAIGATSAGGAVISGTGAFSSIESDRGFAIEIADDSDAYLSLSSTGPNAPYINESDGRLHIDLTGNNPINGGSGVNANAITVIEEFFEIRNQGTQEVVVDPTPLVFFESSGSDFLLVLIVPSTGFPTVTLGVGQAERYSLIVLADGGAGLSLDETMTITAEATP